MGWECKCRVRLWNTIKLSKPLPIRKASTVAARIKIVPVHLTFEIEVILLIHPDIYIENVIPVTKMLINV